MFKKSYLLFLVLTIVGCSYMAKKHIVLGSFDKEKLYTQRSDKELGIAVKSIFDNRCAVCHSCYNSACRLKLTSYEGLMRGGYKKPIYGDTDFIPQEPLRLGIDEVTTKGWRKRGFYKVVDQGNADSIENVNKSLLFKMLTLKRGTRKVPIVLPEETHICASDEEEFNEFIQDKSKMGMPYAMPRLSLKEYYTVGEWIRRGAKNFDIHKLVTPVEEKILASWDKLLNAKDIQTQLSSRYIYEHLFIAHIYFDKIDDTFFSLVRSKTAYPKEIIEIKSTWPYDDPGVKNFYYRFKKITSTIVHKNHITYQLNNSKMKRYNELFYKSDWKQEKLFLPPYGKYRSNPFVTFAQIPSKSRYQYLLDDAYYHIKTFIRGPVCKGQLALNVIDDHFGVFFMKPDSDLFITDKKYSLLVSDYLDIPARGGANNLKSLYRYYKDKQKNYTFEREKIYDLKRKNGFTLEDIWDGDGHSKNATLTVYRHFDSASVMQGFQGGYPKTIWVLDYPIFERIYYNLVAGFNVYGTIFHKSAARQYMDDIRVEAEDNFLSFLPQKVRTPLRKSWYIGNMSQLKRKIDHPIRGLGRPTQIKYTTGYYVPEFVETVLKKRFSKNIYPERDKLNCCELKPLSLTKINNIKDFEIHLKQIINKTNSFVRYIPDLSLMRIKYGTNKYKVYTMIRNRAHLNVSFMFFEELNLDPDNDRINIHYDYVGSYPNRIFDIDIADGNKFFKDITNLNEVNSKSFYKKYSITKNDPRIWEIMDWFHKDFKLRFPIEAGLFDLNRLDTLF